MFKLFRNPKDVVAEIHREFDTAEDRLLDAADKLLQELSIPTQNNIEQKANKLLQLGFENAAPVVKLKKILKTEEEQNKKLVTTREQAELIRYYKRTYPFQKFLTEAELDRICQKYNLIYAPVKNYIKDVPEKNINEIYNSQKLKIEDSFLVKKLLKITKFWDGLPKKIENKLTGVLDLTEMSNSDYEYLKSGGGDSILSDYFNLNYNKYIFTRAQAIEENKEGLFIAAPKSHFNLVGLKKTGKFSFLNVITTEVKDPIVFRYVRGGIQLLSKWGLEAEDEALVNEINN